MNIKNKIKLWCEELGFYADSSAVWDNSTRSLLNIYRLIDSFKPERIIALGVGEGLELRVACECLSPDKITAVEIDRDPFDHSQKIVPDESAKVKIIEDDLRRVDFSRLIDSNEKTLVIASARYSDTSRTIVRKILPLLSPESAVLVSGPVILNTSQSTEKNIEANIRNNRNPLKCSNWIYTQTGRNKILAAPGGFKPLLNHLLSFPVPGFALIKNSTQKADEPQEVQTYPFNPLSFLEPETRELYRQTRLLEILDILSRGKLKTAQTQAAIAVCTLRLGLWDKAARMLKATKNNKKPVLYDTLQSLEKIIKTKLRLIRKYEEETTKLTVFTLLEKGKREPDKEVMESWRNYVPGAQILVFGFFDEEHEDENVRYVPVPADTNGNVFVPVLFALAKQKAQNPILMFMRPDTKPTQNIVPEVTRIRKHFDCFLATGKSRIQETGKTCPSGRADYLVFTKDLWPAIPPFIMDRSVWTSWLIFNALSNLVQVIDTSRVISLTAPHSPTRQEPGRQYNKSLADKNVLKFGHCGCAQMILDKTGFLIRTKPEET